MWNPYYKKALIRLLLSIPILFILFGSSALSFLVAWSRLSAPGWTDTFAMLEQNIGHIECCSAFLLICSITASFEKSSPSFLAVIGLVRSVVR